MSILKVFFADRRLVLLVLSGAWALVLGFYTLSADQAMQVMIKGGYWIMLAITVTFGWNLYRVFRQEWRGWESVPFAPRWPAGMILICGGVLLAHENYGFKILMDEIMLLGTSMSLHFEKLALTPMRGNDIHGAFQIMGGNLDKRPLFHPFLSSLLHDFTGYRPENVFVLNTILTFVLLVLAYRVGRRIGGRPAGAVAVLLLTSLPLLAQNAKGGGFEVLNLVMILVSLLAGIRYIERKDGPSLNVFFLSGVLLALTRYESALFLLPVAGVIVWGWWQEKRPVLTWPMSFAPLFLLPAAWHNRIFSLRESSWELASKPGYEKPFAVSYVPENLSHALNFFFSWEGGQSNSLVLATMGFIALPFFVLWGIKTIGKLRSASSTEGVLAVFSVGFAAHTLLLLCYFWGKFDDPVIRRLSLPLNLFLVLAVVTVIKEFRGGLWRWRAAVIFIATGFFAFSLPAMARHAYSLEYYVAREMEWRREFIAAHPEKDYLFIDNSSIIWVTHLVSATTVSYASLHKENIVYHLKNRTFSGIYVFQRFRTDDKTGVNQVEPDENLGPAFKLESVWERHFTPLVVARISRVVAVNDTEVNVVEASASSSVQEEEKTLITREKAREAYLEGFIKRLP